MLMRAIILTGRSVPTLFTSVSEHLALNEGSPQFPHSVLPCATANAVFCASGTFDGSMGFIIGVLRIYPFRAEAKAFGTGSRGD
jgi:hypothetical protein